MKPTKDFFIVRANTDSSSLLNIIGLDGEPLIIRTNFNPLHHTSEYGEIFETPATFSNRSITSKNLKTGDKIFFSYLVCEEINKVTINKFDFYFCGYDQIWAKVEDNKLIPVDDVLFAHHIIDNTLYSENGIQFKLEETKVAHRVVIHSVNEYSRSLGINEGDVAITIKGAGVPMKDTNMVWLKISNIFGVERNGELIPIKGKNIIKEDESPDYTYWNGLMVGDMHRCKFLDGTFLKGSPLVKENSRVTYIHSMHTRLELDGVKYAVVNDADLIFVNNLI